MVRETSAYCLDCDLYCTVDTEDEQWYNIEGMTLEEWKAAFQPFVLTAPTESRNKIQELLDKLQKV